VRQHGGSLAVVPAYIHFLGIEAYGLIGFFLSLTAILQLLDLGLGTALNRQFSHHSAQSGKAREMRDLLRTLEIIYWLIGIAIGATIRTGY
jgi:O-antigen/teichoic acid export membrane protein